jgi:hypothetical protein
MIIVTASRLGKRGVRVVTNAGRDAMDADHIVRRAMWDADCEGVWSWHPWAGAKPADDDRWATVTNKVMDTGESTQQR